MKINNRTFALVVSLVLMGALIWFFSDIIMYAVLAWVVSMLEQPLMRFFKKIKVWKYKVGSDMAAALTLATFFLGLALLIMVFVPPIITQINNLAHVDYAALGQALQEPLTRFTNSTRQLWPRGCQYPAGAAIAGTG